MYKTILIFLILFSVISKSVSIINGNKTSIETYHWLASVVIADFFLPLSWYAEYTCAGTIIGSKWVITAAHCVPDIPWWSSSEYYIRVGSNDPERNGDMIKVDSINHEHYDPDTHGNDVALVKLASEIAWKYPTHPIEMVNEEYEIIHGLVVRTAGFGETCDDCKISSQLYELYHTTCKPIKRLVTKDDEAKETIMCSEDVNGKSTVCYGDSGAGFIINISGQDFLLGVVSETTKIECNPHIPVFSASIPAYREWIANVTGI